MTLGKDSRRESLELIILSVLSEQPQYGYAIIKQVAARSDGRIRLTPGILYPLLHELEDQKLIISTWETVRSDRAARDSGEGRRRKWYEISARGRRRLSQRIEAHRAYQAMIESFLPGHPSPENGGVA